jgi:hypothetical protein
MQESVRTLIKRKRRSSVEQATWEHNLKRRKLEEEPPKKQVQYCEKMNQQQTVSIETMNQIIWSINPNAFPLGVCPPIVRKRKQRCIPQTPDKNLIAHIKEALTLQKISQKQLADILEVRYYWIVNIYYPNNFNTILLLPTNYFILLIYNFSFVSLP